MQRRALLGLMAAATVPGLVACGGQPFYAPTAEFDHGIQVQVRKAYVRGDRFWVKTYVVNGGPASIQVNRDAWQLRLPSGHAFPRRKSMGQSQYVIPPGQGRNIDVDFEATDETWENVTNAVLVVAGVIAGDDPTPRAVGEVPLSSHPMEAYGPPPAETAPTAAPTATQPAPVDTAPTAAPTDTAAPTEPPPPPTAVPTANDAPPPVTPPPAPPVPRVVP